ncbi:uncharacterized protein LOC120836440 [Ixodes scapularis]|uniref:uncharacterized protein LOC120836440 n=1 Tax=Ixodes scapularis TaxID=6945 RepID=UPI001A9E5CAB|nr:uncharacterized protein LOC120836440 [Ixodes scapularis]
MERVRTKRTARRAQNTRIVREATAILNAADVIQIEAIARKLEVNYEELKKLNTELEPFIADGDLENEYQSVIEYEEETTQTLSMLQSRAVQLRSGEPARPSTSAIAARSEERRRSGIKLPKLQLQSFKGELAVWQPFWQQFKRAIHENGELSSGEKFQYLRTLVSGPAKASIDGLQVTDACYNDAIEILTRQFGDYRRIQQDHLTKLRTLPSVTYSNDTKGLRRLYDQVQTHIRGLHGLGVSSDSYSTMLMDIVIKALPSEIVVDFYRRAGHSERKTLHPYEGDVAAHSSPPTLHAEELGSISGTSRPAELSARPTPRTEDVQLNSRRAEGDLQQLLEYLLIEIESRERSGVRDDRPPRKNLEQLHQRAHLPTSAVLHAKAQDNKKECIFCKTTGHSTENCTSNISLMEKKKKLSGEMRCFRCTLRGHRSKDCHRKLSCTSCAGRHATSMCDPT